MPKAKRCLFCKETEKVLNNDGCVLHLIRGAHLCSWCVSDLIQTFLPELFGPVFKTDLLRSDIFEVINRD